VAIVFSLISAVLYGTSDFIGGRASRVAAPVAIAFFAEIVMLPVALAVIPAVESAPLTGGAVMWGLVAGFTGSVAVVGFYLALARGNMTVVAPVTGVIGAIVPVAVGVASGERPGVLTFVGIAVALVAVALVGGVAGAFGRTRIDATTIVLALAVGVGFGLLFVSLARAGNDSGLWPLLFQRFGGAPVLALAFALQRAGRAPWPGDRPTIDRTVVAAGSAVSVLIAGGNLTYLLATRDDLLSIVAVVVSMYPAATVTLATVIDHERPSRPQIAGMSLAAASLILISLG
jgi:drug/metabolite transporter (DMT)-like permease